MGIQGLIPFLGKATRQVNISQFSGCCVAVDAYCWLHKGAYTCVEKLARGEPCDAYVHYCIKFINMLLSYNIKPILVFDGRHLPAKAATEKKRRESRQTSKKRAAELLRAGRTDEARNFLRRCIDVTHEMALVLIEECRRRNVDCIVAPYEADAQLAYLNIKNIAQIVITEDSDLVLFGCTKIMFKMDVYGNGLLLEQERLHLAMGVRPENFNFDKFRYMCILSGCDYLPSLPGIGLSKACKFITRTADPDIHRALSRLPGHLNMRGLSVTEEYRDEFILADTAFRYQVVFDPLTCRLVHLNEPEGDEKVTEYAGKMLPSDTAYQLALGNLNPFTLEKMSNFDPDNVTRNQNVKTKNWNQVSVAPHTSIWSRSYKVPGAQPRPDPRHVDILSTKGRVVHKDVKLLSQIRKVQEEAQEEISDTELTSMYTHEVDEEPPVKRRRTLSGSPSKVELEEKENSPVSSPVKQTIDTVQEIPPSLASPTSPPPAAPKIRRNPFLKRQPESPSKSSSEMSPSLLGLRERAAEKKFGALAKLGKMRKTEIDESVVVESRFFKKSKPDPEGSSDRKNDVSCSEVRSTEMLKDVSNILNSSANSSLLDVEDYLADLSNTDHSKSESVSKSDIKESSRIITPARNTSSNNVLATLETTEEKVQSISPVKKDSLKKTSLLSVRKLFKSEPRSSPQESSKLLSGSKTFTWCHDKFAFQKSKSIGTLESSSATSRGFKNPFKKVDSQFYKTLEHSESDKQLKKSTSDITETGKSLATSASDGSLNSASSQLMSAKDIVGKNTDILFPSESDNVLTVSSQFECDTISGTVERGSGDLLKNRECASPCVRSDVLPIIKKFRTPFKKVVSSEAYSSRGGNADFVSVAEDEEMVDDPSPVDSVIDLTTISPVKRKLSSSEDMVPVDEGFDSPSSSRMNRSLGSGSQTKNKSCRRLGLSKPVGKQQSLLSMFGFQKKSKLQHA